jgi:hypothetical protein
MDGGWADAVEQLADVEGLQEVSEESLEKGVERGDGTCGGADAVYPSDSNMTSASDNEDGGGAQRRAGAGPISSVYQALPEAGGFGAGCPAVIWSEEAQIDVSEELLSDTPEEASDGNALSGTSEVEGDEIEGAEGSLEGDGDGGAAEQNAGEGQRYGGAVDRFDGASSVTSSDHISISQSSEVSAEGDGEESESDTSEDGGLPLGGLPGEAMADEPDLAGSAGAEVAGGGPGFDGADGRIDGQDGAPSGSEAEGADGRMDVGRPGAHKSDGKTGLGRSSRGGETDRPAGAPEANDDTDASGESQGDSDDEVAGSARSPLAVPGAVLQPWEQDLSNCMES